MPGAMQIPVKRLNGDKVTSMNQKAATGVGTVADTSHEQKIGIAVIAENTSSFTLKFRGSFELKDVDISGSASRTAPWQYVGFHGLKDGSNVAGDTGLVVSSDGVYLIEINATALKQVMPEVTAYTSGKCTVIVYPVNNQ